MEHGLNGSGGKPGNGSNGSETANRTAHPLEHYDFVKGDYFLVFGVQSRWKLIQWPSQAIGKQVM
jgi:hypothetical protein